MKIQNINKGKLHSEEMTRKHVSPIQNHFTSLSRTMSTYAE
jgi:hypothetical protein